MGLRNSTNPELLTVSNTMKSYLLSYQLGSKHSFVKVCEHSQRENICNIACYTELDINGESSIIVSFTLAQLN